MNEQILIIGQGVIIVLISAVIKGVFAVKTELGKLNGRLGRVETWTQGHEKIDDERHQTNVYNLERLREQIRSK